MGEIRRLLLGSFFLLAIAVVPPASAIPIPVGTSAADDIIFNFDFTSSTPSPPYTVVSVVLTITGGSISEDLTRDVFGGLNGALPLASTTVVTTGFPFAPLVFGGGFVSILDGVFSIGLRINTGAVDLTAITATATSATGSTVMISGVPAAVPEPATLALLGLGLAGLGFARRKTH